MAEVELVSATFDSIEEAYRFISERFYRKRSVDFRALLDDPTFFKLGLTIKESQNIYLYNDERISLAMTRAADSDIKSTLQLLLDDGAGFRRKALDFIIILSDYLNSLTEFSEDSFEDWLHENITNKSSIRGMFLLDRYFKNFYGKALAENEVRFFGLFESLIVESLPMDMCLGKDYKKSICGVAKTYDLDVLFEPTTISEYWETKDIKPIEAIVVDKSAFQEMSFKIVKIISKYTTTYSDMKAGIAECLSNFLDLEISLPDDNRSSLDQIGLLPGLEKYPNFKIRRDFTLISYKGHKFHIREGTENVLELLVNTYFSLNSSIELSSAPTKEALFNILKKNKYKYENWHPREIVSGQDSKLFAKLLGRTKKGPSGGWFLDLESNITI